MQRRRQRNMASKNDQSVIDLTKMNKFSFAKLKKLKAVHVISKIAIYFLLICIGFVYLEPIFEMISKIHTIGLISLILPTPIIETVYVINPIAIPFEIE